MKKVIKIGIVLILIGLMLNTISLAKIDTDLYKPTELTGNDYNEAFELGATLVSGIQIIGVVIAIAGIIILGIKYMIGSVEQKAEYKKTLIPYLIGCIFIFAISQIISLIYSLASQI